MARRQAEAGQAYLTGCINNRGLLDKQYVSQDLASSQVSGYYTPTSSWKYNTYAYDGLARVVTQTWADSTTVSHDYSNPWKDIVTNERGYKKGYFFDAFDRLIKVQEYDSSHAVYSTTTYKYDVLANLIEVRDNSNNLTTVAYNWLSRKTGMTDPDMGTWSYNYASNGNLLSQTDAKNQTINFSYDALNRLTGKTYSTGMATVTYSYDSTAGGNYGKSRRTGMSDGSGSMAYKYDSRGRIIQETRTVDSVPYTTTIAYDGASRVTSVTYPTGEVATQAYNGRGLPYSLGSSINGPIVSGMQYNSLGLPVQIDLGNNTRTTYGYWDAGGTYDNPGGYFGKLWEIKTVKVGGNTLQDMKHTWDAGGNLTQRENVVVSETETFSYDSLDRLTSGGGTYATETYAYNQIGNMTSKGGQSYTYSPSKSHAVTAVGTATYTYDANGNMTSRASQTLTWDAENRLTGITGGASAAYVYDGNGFRVKKTEGSATILYVNQYYEKDLTTATVTLYYYLGNKMAAYKAGASVTYVHQDHLTGTSLTTNDSGTEIGAIKYTPFGAARSFSGTLPAQKFTGQRLDDVGLYYYGARYYDPGLGRFISADTVVPDFADPQSLNRYSYVLNNPLKYVDPSGSEPAILDALAAYQNNEITYEQYSAIYDAQYGGWGSEELTATLLNLFTGDSSVAIVGAGGGGPASGLAPQEIAVLLKGAWNGKLKEYEKLLGVDFAKMDQFTKTGVIWGISSGATPSLGPDGTILVEGVLPNSWTGIRMKIFDAGAITWGNVILAEGPTISARILTHEMEHVGQYRRLGDNFLFLYILEYLAYAGYDRMPLEIDARRAEVDPQKLQKYTDWLNARQRP